MILRSNIILILLSIAFLFLTGCYNFKGISIDPEIKSFYVDNFTLARSDMPIDLNQVFTEKLREKIRQESRLVNDNNTPDIVFSGSVTKFDINFLAPDDNSTTSLNRMTIAIKLNYTDENDPEKNWSKSYSDFEDFDSNEDLQSLQDQLIEDIVEDIVERIFNDSFTNW